MSNEEPKKSFEELLGARRSIEPTGIPNLDQVLGGGLPRGALAIIVGPPGSGKTTLANQMAFAAARAGQRAMVLAALSEPTSKLIAHLRDFDFYNDELVGDAMQFISLQQFLSGGLEATSNEMVAAVRRSRSSFVVLDGFRGIRGADMDPQAARQFLYDVGTTLSVLGATTIITSEADARDPAFFPEATTADVIIGLHFDITGVRQRRRLEIIKMRGAAPLGGLHALAIGHAGIIVHPRLESRINQTPYAPQPDSLGEVVEDLGVALGEPGARVPFGLPVLDALLGGGLTPGTNTLVLGSLGTGKTFLGLHFALEGVRRGEPTVFLGFRESYHQLLLKTSPFALGQELRAALAPDGPFTLMRWPPVELNADTLAGELLAVLDRTNAKRLVVDSITELERAAVESCDPRRVENYMAALVEALHRRNVTALFIRETPSADARVDFSSEPVAILAENMLVLRQEEQRGKLRRVLFVQKMRFSAHDASIVREFSIRAPECISVQEDVRNNPEPPPAGKLSQGIRRAGTSRGILPRGQPTRRKTASGTSDKD
ncbi:MAG TPA: ATPase domain-containing protein, partial [Ktedonobacterales bacterium]